MAKAQEGHWKSPKTTTVTGARRYPHVGSFGATGTTADLTSEDLANPAVIDFATGVESAVVHYGDTTLTFLNNLYSADRRGTSLTYVSAVAVEEKSVLDYNAGNPDGILEPGEEA